MFQKFAAEFRNVTDDNIKESKRAASSFGQTPSLFSSFFKNLGTAASSSRPATRPGSELALRGESPDSQESTSSQEDKPEISSRVALSELLHVLISHLDNVEDSENRPWSLFW